MDYRECLDFIIKHYGITAGDLAASANFSSSQLSRFRSAQIDIMSGSLFRLLAQLNVEQRAVYFGMVQAHLAQLDRQREETPE